MKENEITRLKEHVERLEERLKYHKEDVESLEKEVERIKRPHKFDLLQEIKKGDEILIIASKDFVINPRCIGRWYSWKYKTINKETKVESSYYEEDLINQ